LIFGCEYGKDWCRENRDYALPEPLPFLDKHLESGGLRNYLESVNALDERMRRRLEQKQ